MGIFYVKSMKYFVYVIKSAEGHYYTGMTEDLERRLSEHNNKSKSFWTKRGTDWKVIYFEEVDTRQEAMKRERWMKSGHGKKLLKGKGLS
jgi:putative endonuclease